MCRCNTTHCFTEALRCPSRRSRGPVCLRCQNNTEKSSQSGTTVPSLLAATVLDEASISPFKCCTFDTGGSSAPDTGRTKSQLNLQDPVETIAWGGNLPSRRRAITGGLSGLAISKPPQRHCSQATKSSSTLGSHEVVGARVCCLPLSFIQSDKQVLMDSCLVQSWQATLVASPAVCYHWMEASWQAGSKQTRCFQWQDTNGAWTPRMAMARHWTPV